MGQRPHLVLKSLELKRAVEVGLLAAYRGETIKLTLEELPRYLSGLGETGKSVGKAVS